MIYLQAEGLLLTHNVAKDATLSIGDILTKIPDEKVDAIVLAVAHDEFKDLLLKSKIVYYVKKL